MLRGVYFYEGFFLERVLQMGTQVGSCRNYFPLVFLQISGKGALEKTTLKSLGLTGGSAVIRLGGAKFGFFILTFHSGGEFVLFQIPKKKHEKGSKRQTLRHSVIIAFACLSETAAQMCFAQLQMLALTSHVQIKGACLLLFFFILCVCVCE